MSESSINHVSDTAIWVAYYRALETERTGALFQDPLAAKLIGERGEKISRAMKETSAFTRWTVVVRTVVIDRMIRSLVKERGIDLVLNLGAGLDTRPYRLELPETLRWIEVDYPHVIEHKNKTLAQEKPRVRLERVALDLADREKRKALFDRVASESKNVLVITEGVVVYLTEQQVGELGDDLRAQSNFKFWIAEYLAPHTYKYINSARRREQLKNSPFQFMPADWFGFFKAHGWVPDEIGYIGEVAREIGFAPPVPFLIRWVMRLFAPPSVKKNFLQMSAYVVFKPQ